MSFLGSRTTKALLKRALELTMLIWCNFIIMRNDCSLEPNFSTQHPPSSANWLPIILLLLTNFVCVLMLGIICYFCARFVASRRHESFRRLTGDSLFSNPPIVDEVKTSRLIRTGLINYASNRYQLKHSTPKNPNRKIADFPQTSRNLTLQQRSSIDVTKPQFTSKSL